MATGAVFEVDHLLAAILELAAGDDKAWAAGCALVASAWVEPARRLALWTITLRDPLPPASLTALLEREPSLAGAVRELVYSQSFAEHPRTDDGSMLRNVFVGERERAAFVATLSGLRRIHLLVSKMPANFDRLPLWDAALKHCPLWDSLALSAFHVHQGEDAEVAEAFARLLRRVGPRIRTLSVAAVNALDGPLWSDTPLAATSIDFSYWPGTTTASLVAFLSSLRRPPTRLGFDVINQVERVAAVVPDLADLAIHTGWRCSLSGLTSFRNLVTLRFDALTLDRGSPWVEATRPLAIQRLVVHDEAQALAGEGLEEMLQDRSRVLLTLRVIEIVSPNPERAQRYCSIFLQRAAKRNITVRWTERAAR